MKELKKAQMGIIAVLALMLVSIKRLLPGTRKLSSGIATLALAGIVLLVAAGSVSADYACVADDGSGDAYFCGDTVMKSCTLNGSMTCTDGTTYGLLVGASDITIDGAGFSMTGVRSESVCNAAIIGGSPSEQNPAKHSGIVNHGDFDNVVIKNVEITNFCTGIGLGSMLQTSVDDNTVIGCNIHECGDPARITHGIHMVHTRTCDIMKNEISYIDGTGAGAGCSAGGNGIFMYGENSGERGWYNNFTCNYLHNNAKSGFFMKHMCQYCIINYNNATENAEGGIVPMCKQSKHTEIKYNNISNNVQVGYRSQGGDNDLMFNTIMNNGPVGIDIISCADCGTNTVITNNTVCGHTKDVQVGVPAENTADSNTCGSSDIGGACDWSCDTKVSAYYDYDGDNYYSDDPANCSCSVPNGTCACCNPGLFNETHANLLKAAGICVLSGDTHDDPNDCDNSILGAQKPDYIVTAVDIVWLDDAQYNVTYTVKNDGDAAATVESNTSITVDASIIEVITPGLAKDATSNGEVGPFSCSDLSDGVTVCADCNNDLDEISESNNCNSTTTVTCKLPDYRILDKYETWVDEAAKTYNITYLICNNGTRDGTQNTTTKVDTGVTGQPDTNVPPITNGTCIWRVAQHAGVEREYTMSGSYDEITLTANRGSGTMPELDTSNNSITNTFYGGVVVAIDPCPATIGPDPSLDWTTVNITLSDIVDYGSGTIHLYFNESVVDVDSIGLGDSTTLVSNKQANGHYKISALNGDGLSGGNVVFANVTFKPTGVPSDCSYLNLTVETLRDSTSVLETVVNNCTICIYELDGPVVTAPTASPSVILNDTAQMRPRAQYPTGYPYSTNMSNLSVHVTDATNVDSVYIDLTPLGLGIVQMDGPDGAMAGDWYIETNASYSNLTPYCLNVMAKDYHGNWENGTCITLEVQRRGDVTGNSNVHDNKVTIKDFLYIAKYTVDLEPEHPDHFHLVGEIQPAGDWDGIDMADALYIAMYVVGRGQSP